MQQVLLQAVCPSVIEQKAPTQWRDNCDCPEYERHNAVNEL